MVGAGWGVVGAAAWWMLGYRGVVVQHRVARRCGRVAGSILDAGCLPVFCHAASAWMAGKWYWQDRMPHVACPLPSMSSALDLMTTLALRLALVAPVRCARRRWGASSSWQQSAE